MPSRSAASDRRAGSARRRASHSMETVLAAAVELLDEAGAGARPFRALGARLGGGVGSIYWYVASKDELLDRAADHVLSDVLVATRQLDDDPVDAIRTIAVALFDAVAARPWLGAYFMRATGVEQPNGLQLYELMGRQTLRLELTPRQRFHAVSAVIGFVIGTAADLGQAPPPEVLEGRVGRDEYIARWADRWRQLDVDAYPFMHHIAEEFEVHDDADQFRAGLELILDGLRLQAGAPAPPGE